MANTIEWTPVTAIQHALWQDGESQRALAEKLGWNEVKLSKILSGKQRLLVEDLRQIARAQSRDYSWYFEPPPIIHGLLPTWSPRPIDVDTVINRIIIGSRAFGVGGRLAT